MALPQMPHPQPFDLAQAMGGGANQKVFACRRINLYHLKYVQNSRLYGDLDDLRLLAAGR